MRRLATVALIVVWSVSACTANERPEGTVERWLTSLNQGAAGNPDRYADAAVSLWVAPAWTTSDPGWIDEIAVGTAARGSEGTSLVPFRLVLLEGEPISGVATVGMRARADGSSEPVVSDVSFDDVPIPGGWGPRMAAGSWLVAIGVGLAIAVLAIVLVRAVERGSHRSGD